MKDILKFLKDLGLEPKGKNLPGKPDLKFATEVSSLCEPGAVFVAIEGQRADGHDFLADAAEHGASLALVTRIPKARPKDLPLIKVSDTRRALGPLAHALLGDPTKKMKIAGVTGTNGKTTTVYLLEKIMRAAGLRPGLISTVVTRWGEHETPSDETTPSGAKLARILAQMEKDGAEAVAMEVSSHAIDQKRVDGIAFDAIALTNVTQDHLDYHETMEQYVGTKMSIFERLGEFSPGALGVVNLDDPTGRRIADALAPDQRVTYGIRAQDADLVTESILFRDAGMTLNLIYRGERFTAHTPLHCYFNAMNCLTGIATGLALGLKIDPIVAGVAQFTGAPGRFQIFESESGPQVIVDYAHTPDAMTQVLLNARGLARRRLIAVFGCGGDRDRSKRAQMGKVAANLAHELIVTNDNPRTEDPEKIIAEIVEGIGSIEGPKADHRVVLDRRQAIESAIAGASDGDIVVVAGKGHEDYQIIGTEKIHFDDCEVVRDAIASLKEKTSSEDARPAAV